VLGSDADADGEADGAADGAEQEEEEEEEEEYGGDGEEGGKERESRRTHWRECALYREAQRHVSAPSARKTHRHLGIFGLRGFPAEIEHLRDFVPPEWVLPRDDPRLAALGDGDVVLRGAERVRDGVGGDGGGGGGIGITEGRRGQRRDPAATVAEDGEETRFGEGESEEVPYDMSGHMVDVETATLSVVDSQATEELTIF
jgi:hypothetical protein